MTRGAASERRSTANSDARIVILNPSSGSADHADRVREAARERGFGVRATEGEGDAIDLTREAAADGASVIVAAGGDGTVNEVIRGLVAADALDRVTLGIVPCGTGNNFATNVGIEGVDHAFALVDDGEVRTVDLGFAREPAASSAAPDGSPFDTGSGRPFCNSCIGGITAEASADTSPALKSRYGVLAYLFETISTAASYEGLRLQVETRDAAEENWRGEAAFILIGNGRRFSATGRSQANMEDGLFDVTIVERQPAIDLVGAAALERLLGDETPFLTRLKTPALSLEITSGESARFSLDGELLAADRLDVESRPRALRLYVGEAYEPAPTE